MEQTLTLTKEPLKTARLARKADLTIVAKGVLTNETTQTHLSIETDQQVHALILEGVGAVQRWLDMIGTEDATNNFGILYFSQDITKAEQDLEWCKPLLQPSRTSSTTSSTSSIPIKKTVRKNVSATKNGRNTTSVQKTAAVQKETDTTKSRIATAVPKKIPKPATNTTSRVSPATKQPATKAPVAKAAAPRARKPDTGATQSIKSSATKKIPTSKGAGVTKSTPPVSVITGRTRKVSRVDKKDATVAEKKKVASKKQPVVKEVEKTEPSEEQDITPPPQVQKELKEEEDVVPQQEEEQVKEEETIVPQQEEEEEQVKEEEDKSTPVEEKHVDDDEGVVLEDTTPERIIEHSISHVSSGSSATTDEHDAEVAAAMKVTTSRKSSGTPSYFDRAQRFSPTTRPETPEVDQLRQRFETIIKTPTEGIKAPSKISPEFVARIKEMKPKGPAGARVKSMVELFMDENLNKWEF